MQTLYLSYSTISITKAMARLIRAMCAATAVTKLVSASNSCAGLRKNSNTLTTIGLFLWQPMLRWAARIAAILPTTARDFSDYWRADLTFTLSPGIPIPPIIFTSAKKTASMVRAHSTTMCWQPYRDLGGVALLMSAVSPSAISVTARPTDTIFLRWTRQISPCVSKAQASPQTNRCEFAST